MQALALNRKLHLESIIEGEINNLWSLGIADQEGFIYHFDDQFKKLLTLEFGVLKNDIIPCEIIKNLTNSLLYRGNKIIIASKFERDLLYVRVRPVQTIDLLTEIELKVATLINAGLTLHEISDNLCRSINTIRTHSKSIYKKLEINKASQLKDHILKVM